MQQYSINLAVNNDGVSGMLISKMAHPYMTMMSKKKKVASKLVTTYASIIYYAFQP